MPGADVWLILGVWVGSLEGIIVSPEGKIAFKTMYVYLGTVLHAP